MSDQFKPDPFGDRAPEITRRSPPLPSWLARRLLRRGEQVTWVRGPRFNPSWERYVTHPGLFVFALALGAGCVGAGRLIAGSWDAISPVPVVVAACVILVSIFVLGIFSGYFTRLVVTTHRLFIVQGRELCRCWNVDDLPLSLISYSMRAGGEKSRTADLDALQTMLGGASDQFIESKTILAFGKQLDRIKARDQDRS